MSPFLIKPPSSEGYVNRWLLPSALAVLTAGLGVALLAHWMRLFTGVSQGAVIILLGLLVVILLLWRSERAAKRRDNHETLEFFAGLVGKFEQEKTTLQEPAEQPGCERFYREIIEASADPCLYLDLDGRVRYANAAAATVLGCDRQKLDQQELAILMPERYRAVFRAELSALAVGSGRVRREMPMRDGNGRAAWWEWRSSVVSDEQGKAMGMRVTARDLSARKQIEAQLICAQRVQTVEALTSGVIHDLNRLLDPVLGAVRQLQSRTVRPEDRKLVDAAAHGAQQASALVAQLLNLDCGGETEQRTDVDVAALVGELQALLAAIFSSNIEINVRLEPELRTVHASTVHLFQVLFNLCTNARDAMPSGGILRVSARNVRFEPGAVPAPGARPGAYVEIAVSDTGKGIPPELHECIFEPFFSSKPEGNGTGLGLSLVRNIVHQCGGFVRVSSPPGEGSNFLVCLPAVGARASVGARLTSVIERVPASL